MQRSLSALVAGLALALSAGVSVASANGTLVPPAPVAPAQTNVSDQEQLQVVPVAPQVNVQNVNVATAGEVEQGDANNANTGQANQQENASSGTQSTPAAATQENDSDQSQVQVVPVAPQANVQNVNVLTFGDVEQGNANNANTGQAAQQENNASARGSKTAPAPTRYAKAPSCRCDSPSRTQANGNEQKQLQIVPVAPQANVQNVNVLTFGDVEQGSANNANTGQASQQRNTSSGARYAVPVCRSSCGSSRPGPKPCGCHRPATHHRTACGCHHGAKHHPTACGCHHAATHHPTHKAKAPRQDCTCTPSGRGCNSYSRVDQRNTSCQRQIQILPVAPQVNVQNVNVLAFGDVEQGNANNANTGQANQQENSRAGSWCGCSATGAQSNRSEQQQLQVVPIAPQLNVQNLNVLTFGDVEQGNANNANTGQASQQSNTAGVGRRAERPPLLV